METSQTVHMTKGDTIEVARNGDVISIRIFAKGGGYSSFILSIDDAKKMLEKLEVAYNVQ